MLEHGGKLRDAAEQYNIPLQQWLDLSTGINPNPWPIPAIPESAWARLPENNDGLLEVARHYYNAPSLLAVAGSQMAIQALPRLRKQSRVAMLHPSYNEHYQAWFSHGHQVISLEADQIEAHIDQLEVLLLVNPNNPTAQRFSESQLLSWHQQLQQRGGWLIVDEAFLDCTPQQSIAQHSHLAGLIVLRSVGKFFGLAGARIGFVCATETILQPLAELIGPWVLSGPARHIAKAALADHNWQQQARHQLTDQGQRLAQLLSQHQLPPTGSTPLFSWIKTEQASKQHRQLAQQGILTRLFSEPQSIRFGLPKNEAQWQRLESALSQLNHGNQPE